MNHEFDGEYIRISNEMKKEGFTQERLDRILENRRKAHSGYFSKTHWPRLIELAKIGLEYVDEMAVRRERFLNAKRIYDAGIEKVKTTPAPEKQKFPIGSFVWICKDLGEDMAHFTADVPAQVEYTYAHAYGGNNVELYSLRIRRPTDGRWYCSAWYYESQLTSFTDQNQIDVYKEEMKKQDEVKT